MARTGRPGSPCGVKGGRDPSPEYPAYSLRHREQGRVVIRVTIKEDGSIAAVEVLDNAGYPRLAEAAVAAVRTASFNPSFDEDGRAVASSLVMRFDFSLKRDRP